MSIPPCEAIQERIVARLRDDDENGAMIALRDARQEGCIEKVDAAVITNTLDAEGAEAAIREVRSAFRGGGGNPEGEAQSQFEEVTGRPQSQEPSGLERFTAEALDRKTGRVVGTGPPGGGELVVESDFEIPESVEITVLETANDALNGLVRFVPSGVAVASFTFEDAEIENLTVSYDPADDPPELINDFVWHGETTPATTTTIKEAPGLEVEIDERYSFCGPPMAEIRTQFPPFDPADRDPIGADQIAAAGGGAVPGPINGTLKPSASSPIIFTPGGQVVGIDQSVISEENLCLWVEIAHLAPPQDEWTVVLDLRDESRPDAPFEAGVNVGRLGGIPNTRTGAFNAAFVIMDGESPTGLFVDIIEEIERSPALLASVDPDEDLEETLDELEDEVEGGRPEAEQSGLGGGPATEEFATATEEARARRERQERRAEREREREQRTLGSGTAQRQDRLADLPVEEDEED